MADYSPHAIWIKSNGQQYLQVIAPDHYQLGKLEGKFLKKQIKGFKKYIKIIAYSFFWRGMTYKKCIDYALHSIEPMRNYEENHNNFKPLLDEMHGMADAIQGISYEDVLLQNYFIELLYGILTPTFRYSVPDTFQVGCTALGSFDHTGKPLIGQNFDFNRLTRTYSSFVHHRLPETPEVFSFRVGGMLSLPAAKTTNNLMMNVSVVKTRFPSNPIVGTGIRTRWGLENHEKAREMYLALEKEKDALGYNLLISDKKELYALEVTDYGIIAERVKKTAVRTNTFLSDEFQKYLWVSRYSKRRQKYAEKLLSQRYNKGPKGITEKDLLDILSDNPKICRLKTTAYITPQHFGIGRPCKQKHGEIPF